jgi:hypothetical protein
VASSVRTGQPLDDVRDLAKVDPAHDGAPLYRLLDTARGWLCPLKPAKNRPGVETVSQRSRSLR